MELSFGIAHVTLNCCTINDIQRGYLLVVTYDSHATEMTALY